MVIMKKKSKVATTCVKEKAKSEFSVAPEHHPVVPLSRALSIYAFGPYYSSPIPLYYFFFFIYIFFL